MWEETKHGLFKQFTFKNFSEAFAFMTRVAAAAEAVNHHPRWENEWSAVRIWLITHDKGSTITQKDRELAAVIDGLVDNVPSIPAAATLASPEKPKRPLKVKLYSDGGSRGNPGPSASGFVLLDEHNNVLVDDGQYLGVTTNNQAEYVGLKLGLQAAKAMGAREVDAYLDSMLVVNQMRGIFKIKNRDLWPVHDAIKELVKHFKSVHFTHVPREHNRLADAAVNRILDEHLRVERTTSSDE